MDRVAATISPRDAQYAQARRSKSYMERHYADILAGKWESQGAGGGWSWVLSDMESVLETGRGFKD